MNRQNTLSFEIGQACLDYRAESFALIKPCRQIRDVHIKHETGFAERLGFVGCILKERAANPLTPRRWHQRQQQNEKSVAWNFRRKIARKANSFADHSPALL